jgi:chromate transporter
VIGGAALLGLAGSRVAPGVFRPGAAHGGDEAGSEALIHEGTAARVEPTLGRALRVGALWGGLWLAPTAALALTLGWGSIWTQEARFFSQAAVVTFGGAYAVLSYIAQEAVETFGWLQPGEMLEGLGMAETTPGPLIQVVQFVGFIGVYREPGGLPPLAAATLAAVLVTWVTFVPCFLWIFLGAPYVERLREARALNIALSTITAAVVGAVLNLAIWFGIHALFEQVREERIGGVRLLVPALASLDIAALAITAAAFVAIFRFRIGMLRTLGGAAVLGMLYALTLG